MILNRFGEVVWAHIPRRGAKATVNYMVSKQLGPGLYGIQSNRAESYFELVDVEGNILQSLDTNIQPAPYYIHHDFIFSPPTMLLTFGMELVRSQSGETPSDPQAVHLGCDSGSGSENRKTETPVARPQSFQPLSDSLRKDTTAKSFQGGNEGD